MQESPNFCALKSWLQESGGGFHPNALYKQDPSGSSIISGHLLPADSTIVACPFDLVITEAVAKKNVLEILGGTLHENTCGWSERQWISTYLCLHWIIDPQDSRFNVGDKLLHRRYLDTLPRTETLRTPLHFTPSELNLFKGTNLYGATLDREKEWKAEWHQCHDLAAESSPYLGDKLTWERYLTAATYLSSRAFPSSLLSPVPTLVHSPSTQPILIPGVDALNHSRGQPVSWSVTFFDEKHKSTGGKERQPIISLITHTPSATGEELFNNYGLKANAELILGYGFSMPNNPDDTIVLKVGGIEGGKWEVGRNASGAEGLWMEILSTLVESEGQPPTYDDVLDASGMLSDMVENLIQRLPSSEVPNTEDLRPEVIKMFHNYLQGQHDVLMSLLIFCQEKEKDAIAMAQEQGIDLVFNESNNIA